MIEQLKTINKAHLDRFPADKKLKFPENREAWTGAAAVYSEDKLSILGLPVMEAWERPYMAKLAEIATSKGGTVLELGFGMGISASYIQTYAIDKHIVVEANVEVFKKLQNFAEHAEKKVEPLFGFWQDVVSSMPNESVDGILFDVFAVVEGELGVAALSFFKDAYRVLKKGGVFTFFMARDSFLPHHLDLLKDAGFQDIQQELCPVTSPDGCLYCNCTALLAPIIHK